MDEMEKGSGWLVFASIMLALAGIYNVIWGITALARDELLVNRLLFANLTFWGVIWLIIGFVEIIAAFSVLNKAQWARWFGIVMAALALVWTFMAIFVYPVWSVILITLQVLVIYGLAEYGGWGSPGA